MKPAVALIQLPVPDPDPSAALANVPLAAGSLKAYCAASGEMEHSDIRIVPRDLADHGGDAAILSWVKSLSPTIVGFTCSMWNLRRSVWLAERIKADIPTTLTIAGGPEIVSGQPVLDSAAFDSFAFGEGEGAFAAALRDLRDTGRLRRFYGGGPPLDLAEIPNPYLSGAMERRSGDPLYLETMRGCAHRCSYCYYGKAAPGLRFFPQKTVEGIFPWARAHGVPEIYVMDPSFNSSPRWEERLRLLASLNETCLPLHTEIRLESVASAERAQLFARAGFRSVEVGLQSINPRALKAVRRSWRREGFLLGAQLLQERGIEVRTGIILGLPEDSRESFAETVEFLADHDLSSGMEIYPLSVLPGTALREEAAARGIRHMPWPPYSVLSTPTMTEEDILGAIRDVEKKLAVEFFVPIPPHFHDECPEFEGFLDLRNAGALEEARPQPERLANSITILLDVRQIRIPSFVEDLGAWFLHVAPHGLYQIVVESDTPLNAADEERVAEAFHDPGHWLNQARHFSDDPQGRFSVRLFRLARGREGGGATGKETADLILRFTPRLLSGPRSLIEDTPFLLLDRPLSEAAARELAAIYKGLEKLLCRAPRPL